MADRSALTYECCVGPSFQNNADNTRIVCFNYDLEITYHCDYQRIVTVYPEHLWRFHFYLRIFPPLCVESVYKLLCLSDIFLLFMSFLIQNKVAFTERNHIVYLYVYVSSCITPS